MGRRRRKTTADHAMLRIVGLGLTPVQYYMEDEIDMALFAQSLADASMEEFVSLFKGYHRNYFSEDINRPFKLFGNYASSDFRLFINDEFFKHFSEGKYYCKRNSFESLPEFLVKEHYPNETEYIKTVRYVNDRYGHTFTEGSGVLKFKLVGNP